MAKVQGFTTRPTISTMMPLSMARRTDQVGRRRSACRLNRIAAEMASLLERLASNLIVFITEKAMKESG